MSIDVVDYCAGIGGWDVALQKAGLRGAGIENALWPRIARQLNGLTTVHDDLLTFPKAWQKYDWAGAVGSFPCQPFSQNIKGAKAAAMLEDPRARLMLTGLRHLKVMLPPFVCLENVSKASVVMNVLAGELRKLGYSADVKVINAADYGLPQTRKRALLVARRDGLPIVWPEPTHAKDGANGLLPWVTLSEAVGRTFEGLQSWGNDVPCVTVVGSYHPQMHAPPVYRGHGAVSRQNDPGAIELSLEERLLIQGFPKGWKLAGPETAQGLQVGNAIPPVLAEVALEAVGALSINPVWRLAA